jgi:hypothetical protein
MQRTNIYLEDRQTRALDQLAGAEGVSRAEIIRRLIDRGIETSGRDLATDLAWFDASFGVATDFAVPDRGHGRREAHLDKWRRA